MKSDSIEMVRASFVAIRDDSDSILAGTNSRPLLEIVRDIRDLAETEIRLDDEHDARVRRRNSS